MQAAIGAAHNRHNKAMAKKKKEQKMLPQQLPPISNEL
jgi:hypothetical protein